MRTLIKKCCTYVLMELEDSDKEGCLYSVNITAPESGENSDKIEYKFVAYIEHTALIS